MRSNGSSRVCPRDEAGELAAADFRDRIARRSASGRGDSDPHASCMGHTLIALQDRDAHDSRGEDQREHSVVAFGAVQRDHRSA